MKRIILSFFLVLPIYSFAADDPSVVIGAQEFDTQECLDRNTDDCISSVCPNSEERDCPDQCRAKATDKCKEKSE